MRNNLVPLQQLHDATCCVAVCHAVQALSACLLVPVLLGVIRQVQREHGPSAAAAVTVGSLLLLLVADTISRRAQKQQAAAQAACVTAATLHQQLSTGTQLLHTCQYTFAFVLPC